MVKSKKLRSLHGLPAEEANHDQSPPSRVIKKVTSNHFVVSVVETTSGLLALQDEWRALESRLPALPFVCFDWNVAWWQHMREHKASVTDKLAVRTFRSSHGELCAIAPLMLTIRPGVGPLQVRQLQFFGADPNMTEVRGIVTPDDLRQEVYLALLESVRSQSNSWDWFELSGLPNSPTIVSDVEQRFIKTHWREDLFDYVLSLAPSWDDFRTQLPRNIKESLRKCANAPKRDGIKFSLDVVREPTEVAAGVEAFLRLHRVRAELHTTVRHKDVFATECTRLFLLDVCNRFATRDALRIFQLKHSGKIVATRIGFVLGDSLYLYYSGYDSTYAQYSVMTTLVAESIRYAIGEGFRTVNLSTGNDVSKQRWNPEFVKYRNAVLVSPSLRGSIAYGTYSAAMNALKSCPASTQLRRLFSRRV
jgi:CelD/BcsL family acetyltransferase involved in cellulose biosynthesis